MTSDGQDDLWVGGPGLQGEPREGVAHLFLGPLTGTLEPSNVAYSVHGERLGDFFGREIVPVDGDGDGRGDVVISASSWGAGPGAVYLIRGADLPL